MKLASALRVLKEKLVLLEIWALQEFLVISAGEVFQEIKGPLVILELKESEEKPVHRRKDKWERMEKLVHRALLD
jgi:hypothetical protein